MTSADRLNVLGFLALDELSGSDPLRVSGNFGFSDQLTALRWAHDDPTEHRRHLHDLPQPACVAALHAAPPAAAEATSALS